MKEGTMEKIQEIKTLIKGGMKLGDALEKTKTSHNTWYTYKNKKAPQKKAAKPFVQEFSIPRERYNTPNKVVAVLGNPASVGEFIKKFLHEK